VSKAPVIAVRGGFGDGKSSILNLLHKELRESAIVVLFSSWLPDSQRTLVQDLFGDIASECNRAFIIPGLRKHLTKFATIIAGTTPQLKILPDLLPTYTQRQEIRDLGKSLGRLPKRVVVLLDEIDRMEKDEILTLLKVIRGAHILPNLTFVCALNQNHVEELTRNSFDTDPHEFFEKFFPVAFDLPKPSPEILKKMLCDRIQEAFEGAHWFHNAEERNTFLDGLTELWNAALKPICSNIRKVNLFANDIHGTALLASGEVNALDLCALEALRRFFPAVYELIWRKAQFFSMSYEWWKTREHRTDAFLVQESDNIGTQIKGVSKGDRDAAAIRGLLTAMFPDRVKELYSERPPSSKLDTTRLADLERGKRIAHPDYLPVYFRYEVPDTIFSSREMADFIARMSSAKSPKERREVFDDLFSSLEDGSVRRYDFIQKLVSGLGTVEADVAKSIALSLAANAHRLGDDFLVSEGRRARVAVLAVAQLLSRSDEINAFIMEVIFTASTDMFAAQICRSLTNGKDNEILLNYDHVDKHKIQEAFAKKMNSRYGDEADVSNLDASALTSHPFYVWSTISDEERRKEIAFWERFIGRDRAKLAEAFNIIAPIDEFWTRDTPATIDQMIPIDMLKSLCEESTSPTPVDERQEKSLSRLKTFLDQQAAEGSATA
jgi:KAP family P-loop domain